MKYNSINRFPALVAVGAVAILLSGGRTPGQTRAYTFEPVKNGMQLKTPDGRVVLEYLTTKPDGSGLTSASAACFHPVNTPTGERVTALAPDDHPHHRGIFLGWHDAEFREPSRAALSSPTAPIRAFNVRKADFWGWGVYATRENRVIANKEIKLASADAGKAQIEIHNEWAIMNLKVLDESDSAIVTERDGVYVLDLEYRLTPVFDYVLNRASFGGFDVQCRKDGDSYYATEKGKVSLRDPHYSLPELNWPAEAWYDFTIKLRGNGKTVGAAVIDHPKNPVSTWHNSRTLWMLNPSISAAAPITLPAGETFRLRYRVVMHDGDTPTELLQKLSAEYRGK